jgi:hypothetical protein
MTQKNILEVQTFNAIRELIKGLAMFNQGGKYSSNIHFVVFCNGLEQ